MSKLKVWSIAAVLSCLLVSPVPASQEVDLESMVAAMANVGGCWSPSFSPDGRSLAFVSTLSGVPQVWVMPVEGGFPRQVTSFPDPIQAVSWAPDGQHLSFVIFPGGGMNSQVYIVRPDGTRLRRVSDGGKETNLLGPWAHDGRVLAFASARRDPSAMDTYLFDLASGSSRMISKNTGLGSFMELSPDGKRGILWRMEQRTDENLYLVDLDTGRERLLTPHEPPGSFPTGQFSPDGSAVYLQSNQNRDVVAFGRVKIGADGQPGPIEVLAARPDADLQEFEITRDGKTAALIWNVGGQSDIEFLNLETLQLSPGPKMPTEIGGDLIFSYDGSMVALAGLGSASPPNLFTYNRQTGELRQVTYSQHPGVALDSLVKPEPVRYVSFDGIEISGWLYKPRNAKFPAPLVVIAHGGPEEQERPSFLGTYQALVARGMAVFAPNFRGSSGFGKKFQNLDNGELRLNVPKDIKAGVDHLVSQGIADPKRIGMFGFSYGGYLTLMTLSEYPDLFAAAASLSGMVNFETFFAHTEPWMATISRAEYGDPVTQKDLLKRLSPIHRLDRVITPTLVLHGANDTNVPVIEAEQVVENLKGRSIPVEYILFPDEGHGVEKVTNRVKYAAAIVNWFEKYLVTPSR